MGPVERPSGRTIAEVVEELFRVYQAALSCVTDRVLQGRAFHPAAQPHAASFAPAGPVKIGRQSHLFLDVLHLYNVVSSAGGEHPWHASTAGYCYEIRDRQQGKFISYHWHPVGNSSVTYPHLHVSGRAGSVDLSKAHLPTGRVSLVAVLRMTITELGVELLRDDWNTVLNQAERDLARQ